MSINSTFQILILFFVYLSQSYAEKISFPLKSHGKHFFLKDYPSLKKDILTHFENLYLNVSKEIVQLDIPLSGIIKKSTMSYSHQLLQKKF